MAQQTGIQWTERTWNPIVGCSVISPGCKRCYAMRMAARLAQNPSTPHYAGTVRMSKAGAVWTGKLAMAPDRILLEPLREKQPRIYFVNSMSDLFHEAVPDDWIDRVFAVMALCRRHTFQVLTKRSKRMRGYFADRDRPLHVTERMMQIDPVTPFHNLCACDGRDGDGPWPLPNVWLGVSTEDQERADERIPDLLATPAAVRFISAEPLLGPIDLRRVATAGGLNLNAFSGSVQDRDDPQYCGYLPGRPRLDWVIAGGESGMGARPMHPDWARALRDQCQAAGVPFFFKQWGEWAPGECSARAQTRTEQTADWWAGAWHFDRQTVRQTEEGHRDDEPTLFRLGKRAAGRRLDGREWGQMPGGFADRGSL